MFLISSKLNKLRYHDICRLINEYQLFQVLYNLFTTRAVEYC